MIDYRQSLLTFFTVLLLPNTQGVPQDPHGPLFFSFVFHLNTGILIRSKDYKLYFYGLSSVAIYFLLLYIGQPSGFRSVKAPTATSNPAPTGPKQENMHCTGCGNIVT